MRVYLSGAISDVSYAYANQWRDELTDAKSTAVRNIWKIIHCGGWKAT